MRHQSQLGHDHLSERDSALAVAERLIRFLGAADILRRFLLGCRRLPFLYAGASFGLYFPHTISFLFQAMGG